MTHQTICDGASVSFWTDRWLERTTTNFWQIPNHLHFLLDMHVVDYIVDNSWNLPTYFRAMDRELTDRILSITLPSEQTADKLNWTASTDGTLTNKLAFAFSAGTRPKVIWSKLLWNTFVLPTRAYVCLRFLHNKLPTYDNLRKHGFVIVSRCCLCL